MDPISRLLNLFENGIIFKEDLSNGMFVLRQQAEAKIEERQLPPKPTFAPPEIPKRVPPALPATGPPLPAVVNPTHFTDDEIDALIGELIPDDLEWVVVKAVADESGRPLL